MSDDGSQKRTVIEGPIYSDAEAGPSNDTKELAEVLARASAAFFHALRNANLAPSGEAGIERDDRDGVYRPRAPYDRGPFPPGDLRDWQDLPGGNPHDRGPYDRGWAGHDRS
jgi:hypothetical protein